MIRPGELVIDDSNYLEHVEAVVDGHTMGRGYVERDYSINPVGSYRGVEPFKLAVIPRSEWPSRIKDGVEAKATYADLRTIGNNGGHAKSLDQNGQGYCHTEDTEILTENGWVLWPEYDGSSAVGTMNKANGELEFQIPIARQVFDYKGEIVGSTNRRIDFAVTPNHRMLVHKWDESKRTLSSDLTVTTAGNLGWYAGLPHSTKGWTGIDVESLCVDKAMATTYSGDDFVALLGLIVSDGFAGGAQKNQNVVSFASFREDMRSVIEPIAIRCGFREKESARGVWIKTDHEFANWIRKHCYIGTLGAHSKKVPAMIGELSMRQIALFLKFFDDRNRDSSQFYSVSKRLIDDIQVLLMKLGKRSHIGQRPAKVSRFGGNASGEIRGSSSYVLTVGGVDRLCIDKKKHVSQDRYCGNVFCATVPNDTLITRRNGSVLISCNCWAYSTAAAIIACRIRDNQPYVRLSAHAVAFKIKNGKDQGGWNPLSVEFAIKTGYPDVSVWPEKSMNRTHDNTATWLNAARNKIVDGWMELTPPVYDRNLTFDQLMTCLLLRIPCPVDYSWWGHSVCAVDPVEVDSSLPLSDIRRWGVRIWNSWTDNWGTLGMGVLAGNKAVPNGATACKGTTQS